VTGTFKCDTASSSLVYTGTTSTESASNWGKCVPNQCELPEGTADFLAVYGIGMGSCPTNRLMGRGDSCEMSCNSGFTPMTITSGSSTVNSVGTIHCRAESTGTTNFAQHARVDYSDWTLQCGCATNGKDTMNTPVGYTPTKLDAEINDPGSEYPELKKFCDNTYGEGQYKWWKPSGYAGSLSIYNEWTCMEKWRIPCNGKDMPVLCQAASLPGANAMAAGGNGFACSRKMDQWPHYDWEGGPCSDSNLAKEGAMYSPYKCPGKDGDGAAVFGSHWTATGCSGNNNDGTAQLTLGKASDSWWCKLRGSAYVGSETTAGKAARRRYMADNTPYRTSLWYVCHSRSVLETKVWYHARVWVFAVPIIYIIFAVPILLVPIRAFMAGNGSADRADPMLEMLGLATAVLLWFFSTFLIASPYQVHGMFGLALMVVILSGHSCPNIRYSCIVVILLYIGLIFFPMQYKLWSKDYKQNEWMGHGDGAKVADDIAEDYCREYFDHYFEPYLNNAVNKHEVYNQITYNQHWKQQDKYGWGPQQPKGMCHRQWLAACAFFNAFQLLAAVVNLAILCTRYAPEETLAPAAPEDPIPQEPDTEKEAA
jgi:hypothetical protein